jgi:hypothetical protein
MHSASGVKLRGRGGMLASPKYPTLLTHLGINF